MALSAARAGITIMEKYTASMVLSGVGDSLGYRHGAWEFNYSGPDIHEELKKLGGLSKLPNKTPYFIVSDDTVLHLATARALVDESSFASRDDLLSNCAGQYIIGMTDMSGRGPGACTTGSCALLERLRKEKPAEKIYRIPFKPRGGGCGAAMRAMCIGLRYPDETSLKDLIAVSIESGRITHNHPTGYLGALVAALFTSYAIQNKQINNWGYLLVNEVLPQAKEYIIQTGIEVQENLDSWSYFEEHWRNYLQTRGISEGDTEPMFPDPYGVKERDAFYESISFSGWGGSSGHDSTIIAYDAILGCQSSWEEFCHRGVLHGGDNDSTGSIGGAWFGALYGFDGVYDCNHQEVEYRDQMVDLASKLYNLSHPALSDSNTTV